MLRHTGEKLTFVPVINSDRRVLSRVSDDFFEIAEEMLSHNLVNLSLSKHFNNTTSIQMSRDAEQLTLITAAEGKFSSD